MRKRRPKRIAQLVPIADIAIDGVRAILETAPYGVVLTLMPSNGGTRIGFAGEANEMLTTIDCTIMPSAYKRAALQAILKFALATAD